MHTRMYMNLKVHTKTHVYNMCIMFICTFIYAQDIQVYMHTYTFLLKRYSEKDKGFGQTSARVLAVPMTGHRTFLTLGLLILLL